MRKIMTLIVIMIAAFSCKQQVRNENIVDLNNMIISRIHH
jgi:hypothetical protein